MEYNNQQAEHFRAYGSAGLAIGFWPFVAEAIHGDFGWHEVIKYGFTDDGVAHEGGAYDRAIKQAMQAFSVYAKREGIDLASKTFRRILTSSGRATSGDSSVLMETSGYIYLRKKAAPGLMEIGLNYIQQFDRTERDRFTTFFKLDGKQVDSTVGRINYGSPRSKWMYATAAHNAIVVDGKSEAGGSEGNLIAFDASTETPIAAVTTDPRMRFYEGVNQIRCIAILGSAYVVFDYVWGDQKHDIDRYQWGKGSASLKCDAGPVDDLGSLPSAGGFSGITGGPSGNEVRIDFSGGLKMRVVGDGPMEAYKAKTVAGYQARPAEVTFVRRPDAKTAAFLATFSTGETTPPAGRITKTSPSACECEVEADGQTHRVLIEPGANKVTVTPN